MAIFKEWHLLAPIQEATKSKCVLCLKEGQCAAVVAYMQTHEKEAVHQRGTF